MPLDPPVMMACKFVMANPIFGCGLQLKRGAQRQTHKVEVVGVVAMQDHGAGQRIDAVDACVHASMPGREVVRVAEFNGCRSTETVGEARADHDTAFVGYAGIPIAVGCWALVNPYSAAQAPSVIEAIHAADRNHPTVAIVLDEG